MIDQPTRPNLPRNPRPRSGLFALIALLSVGAFAAVPHAEEAPGGKTVSGAYIATAVGTAAPILLGSLMLSGNSNGMIETIGAGLVYGGIVLGPAAGQFYSGSWGHGTASSALRLAGGVMLVAGVFAAAPSMSCLEREPGDECEDKGLPGLAIVGGATFLGGTLYSLLQAPAAVRHYNERARRASLELAPKVAWSREGGLLPGAVLTLRFQ